MKWEYLVRQASASELNRFQELLCELGAKGWELITVNSMPTNDLHSRLIFKRPIQDAPMSKGPL